MNDEGKTVCAFVQQPDQMGSGPVFDLGTEDGRRQFLDEVTNDGHYDPYDDPDVELLVVTIKRMPAGYVESLSEFEGW